MAADPLLAIEQLRLSLGGHRGLLSKTATRILNDVSVTVGQGEILGIVGESGSGKTTLGKAVLRLYRPEGRILYAGQDLAKLSERALRPFRRKLQMVFQDPLSSFNPRFKIADSIAVPLRLHGGGEGRSLGEAVAALLGQVGLSREHGERFPHELSGGQLQRAAIARVLGLSPELIVADEAVSKLDVSVRAQILNLIKRVNRERGVAFVFITHDLTVARFLCDRVAVMYAGRIVELGKTQRIFERPQHPYTLSLINARREPSLAVESDNAVLDPDAVAEGCAFAPRCWRRKADCLARRPDLLSQEGRFVACFHPNGEVSRSAPDAVPPGLSVERSEVAIRPSSL